MLLATVDSPQTINWIAYLLLLAIAAGFSLGLRRIAHLQSRFRLQRWVPLAHILIWTLATGAVLVALASQGLTTGLGLFVLALLAFFITGLDWLRHVAAGLVLLNEPHLRPGERIQVGDRRGRIQSIGLRSLQLRDDDGVLHDIPHRTLIDQPSSRYPHQDDAPCQLELRLHVDDDPSQVLQRLQRIAGLAPLASPRKAPRAFLSQPPKKGQPLHITLQAYPFSSDHRDPFKSDLLTRIERAFH